MKWKIVYTKDVLNDREIAYEAGYKKIDDLIKVF